MKRLPQAPPQLDSPPATASAPTPTRIGVGIDTSRYGHYATFLRPDLQPAAPDLKFTETAHGYAQLRDRFQAIAQHGGPVQFHIRLDAAGQYADNLFAFLQTLFDSNTAAAGLGTACLSCGETQRNKNYRTAIFGHKKSDPVESAALARYAVTEPAKPSPSLSPQLRLLRQVAGRLASQRRQCTRLINQLHNLLARVFPELALVAKDLSAGWVLQLLQRYPTAAKLATARRASLEAIPYLDHERIPVLQAHARASVASLTGPEAAQLIQDQVRQLRAAQIQCHRLEKLLIRTYRQLPQDNHLHTIIGIGEVTAAVLTAFILTIDRFETENKLVGYFGVFPSEASSGIDRDGQRRAPKRMVMSPRGCDLVRYYLYNAALSAAQHNPAVRPVYQRVRAKHPEEANIAVGHAMTKLLHLTFAVWKTGRPFDPGHDDGEQSRQQPDNPPPSAPTEHAAGHHPESEPEKQVVTAARSERAGACNGSHPATPPRTQGSAELPRAGAHRQPPAGWIDFAHLRRQLPLQRLLEHLGCFERLRGRGEQRRGPCPVHSPERGRTFSVHLGDNVFQCFDPVCGCKGDIIDLWAALHQQSLRDAAQDLVRTFGLEAAPQTTGAEKRNG